MQARRDRSEAATGRCSLRSRQSGGSHRYPGPDVVRNAAGLAGVSAPSAGRRRTRLHRWRAALARTASPATLEQGQSQTNVQPRLLNILADSAADCGPAAEAVTHAKMSGHPACVQGQMGGSTTPSCEKERTVPNSARRCGSRWDATGSVFLAARTGHAGAKANPELTFKTRPPSGAHHRAALHETGVA